GRAALLLAAALALGLAVGTKYTFIVPAVALAAGAVVLADRMRRTQAAGLMVAGIVATGGWWYLRALIADGNPLGLSVHLGPVTLPGAHSPLASSQQTAVISQIFHSSLWFSRFAPGLHYALGPMWPLVILIA